MTLEEVIKDLYESEINVCVHGEFDKGFWVAVGNDITDTHKWWKRCRSFDISEFDQIGEWLKSTAIKLYPDSEFSRRFK